MAEKATTLKRAPDGGPIVDPRRKFKGVKRLAGIMVIRKYDPDRPPVRIAADQFDPEMHEKVGTGRKPKPRRARLDDDGPNHPRLERKVLATLSVAELKKLPEWEDVEGKSRLTNKEAIVTALLAVGGS